ncbi:MAG TPA: class I SAM-dependent methyltransferase [Candidatus Deferrimicrobium sp.]|nr:class I SAM-dependent methyltransferase [Candidatus Deferrimicrobium sp.]
MPSYYSHKLSADRLRQVYEIAPPAVQAYLKAEIEFVISRLSSTESLLELGCGYGRVIATLSGHVDSLWGIDTSLASLRMARDYLGSLPCHLIAADASRLPFPGATFDVVVCIQNGISAFAIEKLCLMKEAVRVTRPGGKVLFSSYAESFWPHRLAWFEAQAEHGLIGEIDYQATGNGVIVCKDGFRAVTDGPGEFQSLAASIGIVPRIVEVAHSSLFCELIVPHY